MGVHTPEKKKWRGIEYFKKKNENCELRDPVNFFSEVKDRIFLDYWFNYSEA